MKNTYDPTREEMISVNRKLIESLPLQEDIKEYLLEKEDDIVNMMDKINNVDNTLDYTKVFILVSQVFIRNLENL